MAKNNALNLNLPSVDDLFSTEESRTEAKLQKVQELPLAEIDDFPDHPFQVREDDAMLEMVESIKRFGVLTPAVARQKEDNRYELISGHRRKRACELAGLETLPTVVREMSRDEAIIFMVDSNLQREVILPSEKAFSLKMRLEAMKRQAGRPSKENSSPMGIDFQGKQSLDILGETVGESRNQMAQSQPLYLGKFEVRETTAPDGMVLNGEIHSVELAYAGQEVEITETATNFYNERQKVEITLEKLLEQDDNFQIGMNGELAAVTFGLYASENITASDGSVIPADGLLEIVSFDENGHGICKSDLPFSHYYLKELATDSHYLISDEKYPVVFDYAGQDTALVEIKANDGKPIENKLLRGEIKGIKKDKDGKGLDGALIGLFKTDETEFTKDTAILTATSEKDGSFSFADVPFGTWQIREIEAPTGYVLSDETFAIVVDEDGAVIEVEIENILILGNVQLTKVDKDFPDNKLTGAEFELYRDSNGNQKHDKEDELLGALEESAIGVYGMNDLTYSGYFIKESKAPEGFVLDENAYYFEITENGKTVTVENEAGKGFVNEAQKGSLKIVKTSSNGKVEGFSFRITGAGGYDQTFITDKNGEIFIENLRIGDYTVSEVLNGVSSGYILPADEQTTVKVGATTTVTMHNELRDTPKTGDNSNPALWLALLGISAVGAVTLGILGFKKKKKDKEDE